MTKTPKVALLIETSRGYGRELLRGIAKYSRLHGPWMFYRTPPFYLEPKGKEKILSRLKSWGADGLILRDSKKAKEAITLGLPTIVAVHNKYCEDLPSINPNNAAIAKMAAEHLLNHGFRRFAYCGFDEMEWSRERSENFGKVIAEAGFETHFYKQPRSKAMRSWNNEQAIMANWLKSLHKPVGLMACNDDCGQHIAEACKLANLHVPEQVAIIGVDNDELVCDLSNPPLSSVALNTKRTGYEAAELLDKLMAGEKMAGQLIIVRPTHVVTRRSTDILAIEDSEVAKAMQFIRWHSRKTIQVGDVVNAVPLSRRVLERRFRGVLGRSIHSEIRRLRIEQATLMLVETNLSISQIALALEYSCADHIARYFRQEMGVSPLAYRKQHSHR